MGSITKKTLWEKICGRANYVVRSRCGRVLNLLGVPLFVQNFDAAARYGAPLKIESSGIFTRIIVDFHPRYLTCFTFDRFTGKFLGTGYSVK